jgi:hydroxymethylglutaryl-CoA lyase
LADAAELVRRLPEAPDVTYWALVPNRVGLERALDAGLGAVATFMSVSETHNKKNVNRTVAESRMALAEVVANAVAEGLRVRSYLSTVFGCPYEGSVDVGRAVELARAFLEAGAETISLGDTIGVANPVQVRQVLDAMSQGGVPLERIALHLHDTRGTALANVLAGFQAGVRTFDASTAGLGGCPYAPGASGNLASEDLIYMLDGMSVVSGVTLDLACEAGAWIAEALGHRLPGRAHRAFLAERARSTARSA